MHYKQLLSSLFFAYLSLKNIVRYTQKIICKYM